MMKKLSKIKFENILSLLWIPIALIQIQRASLDFKIVALLMEGTILFGIFYTTKEIRKEFKKIASELDDTINESIKEFETIFEQTKKETLIKAKSIFHKRNASKSLSCSIINQIS